VLSFLSIRWAHHGDKPKVRNGTAPVVAAPQDNVQQFPDGDNGELHPAEENFNTDADREVRIPAQLVDSIDSMDQKLDKHIVVVELNVDEYDLTGLTGTIIILSYSCFIFNNLQVIYLFFRFVVCIILLNTWMGMSDFFSLNNLYLVFKGMYCNFCFGCPGVMACCF
jgi:hypothetical protein